MDESMKIMDPRGFIIKEKLTLAPRPTLDELRKGRILIYNNTKVEFCNYTEIIPQIKRRFEEIGVSNFLDVRKTVRGMTARDLQEYAKVLAEQDPTAVIIALGDMGVSPASTILTIALEKLGIPTVLITASPGAELAQATAFYHAGELCLCEISLYQGNTKEEVREQIDCQFDCIVECLTLPADQIRERSTLKFSLDQTLYESGLLEDLNETLANTPADEALNTVMEYFHANHLGDGLPIIPPTVERYNAMMAYCPYDENLVIAEEIGPAGKDITIRDIAVGAVMAGCRPEYMPVLVTAFKAMSNPKYNFLQSVTTSHPGGNLVLVSGPIAKELNIFGGQGCLGPGFVANATIGRAVNLVIINACRSVPGICDLDCIASPAEYSYCFGEDPELTPWPTINEEKFDADTTTVTVLKAEPPHDIIDFLSPTAGDLLDTICDSCTTLGSNNSYIPGPLIIVITPDHARLFHRDGYDKKMIREHIHRHANHLPPLVRNRGLMPVRPEGFDDMHPIPVTRSPEDVEVVVAGGRGGHSAVILPWALHSEAITEPIRLPDGKIARKISEFKR